MGSRLRRALCALMLGSMMTLAPSAGEARHVGSVIAMSYAPDLREDPLDPDLGTNQPQDPGTTRLTGVDLPDVTEANQTHAIYFVPSDRTDQNLDADGSIARSIDSIRAWFTAQMGRKPRFDRIQGGGWDITFVRGWRTASTYLDLTTIADELQERGFKEGNKRYLIYAAVNRGSICGAGFYPLVPGQGRPYHAVYLDSTQSCGSRDFGGGSAATAGKAETTIVQEWLHNEGIVSPGSPRHCAPMVFHVCTAGLSYVPGLDPEEVDTAFPFVTDPLSKKVLDRGRDDYLDHGLPHVADLRGSAWLE